MRIAQAPDGRSIRTRRHTYAIGVYNCLLTTAIGNRGRLDGVSMLIDGYLLTSCTSSQA